MLLSRINIISACSICTLVNSNNAVRVGNADRRVCSGVAAEGSRTQNVGEEGALINLLLPSDE